jgi:hypothetical protein
MIGNAFADADNAFKMPPLGTHFTGPGIIGCENITHDGGA